MKKYLTKTAVLLIFSISVSAQVPILNDTLDHNNLRVIVNNVNAAFWDPQGQTPLYEIPKGGGLTTLYSGNLWIGGYDNANQLHLSAATYLQSGAINYWPGPLDITNATAANPFLWNLSWKLSKTEILNHIANWNSPGYIVPAAIANWPGNAPAGSNYNPVLAPFFDGNGNQIYEPILGEFPVILGEQSVYYICNDNYSASYLNVPSMKVEIHASAYQFADPSKPFLDNSLFYRYQVVNRSGIDYNNVRIALWTDGDLGNASDDYYGSDVGRNMYYYYNGDSIDEGAGGYGLNVPAQGIKFLSHPMTSAMFYQNMNNAPTGNPDSASTYYNYMNTIWADSQPVTFGGDGRNAAGVPAKFMFCGTTDPAFVGQDWTMGNASIPPDDVRGLGTISIPSFAAGQVITLDAVYLTAFPDNGQHNEVPVLQAYADSIQARYSAGTITFTPEVLVNNNDDEIIVYPNPVAETSMLSLNTNESDVVVNLFSVEGKLMATYTISNNDKIVISKKQFAPGVYVVTAQLKNGTITKKIIVN